MSGTLPCFYLVPAISGWWVNRGREKCRKKESILTDDMIMKFDLNIWGIWVKQRLRLLVYVSFPMTQIKNILRCLNVHVCLEGE